MRVQTLAKLRWKQKTTDKGRNEKKIEYSKRGGTTDRVKNGREERGRETEEKRKREKVDMKKRRLAQRYEKKERSMRK